MASSNDSKTSDNFPHKHIPPIVGQPTYEAIKELHLKLNENAVKVHSNLSNGLLGYLGVTVTPAIYNTLLAQPLEIPLNPGVAPVFPPNAHAPVIHNICVVFKEQLTAFKKYMDVCNAIWLSSWKSTIPCTLQPSVFPTLALVREHLYKYSRISTRIMRRSHRQTSTTTIKP